MSAGRVLVLLENEPVPQDKRTWAECGTLRRAGFEVTVVCPQGDGEDAAPFERRDGVTLHRYPPASGRDGVRGHVAEYAHAARRTAALVRRLARRGRFDVVHAGNPPDFLLLTALPLKRHGTRFVFDHHDLSPELFAAIYGHRPLLHAATRLVERAAFAAADVVVATNESYRDIAVRRGGKDPADVFVVRNAPDSGVFHGEPAPVRDGPFVLAYAGVMGHQDGVAEGLEALAALRRRRGDWRAVFVGDGPALPGARRLASELGIADAVEFPGWVSQDVVRKLLDEADVCLSPEPDTPYSRASTLIKIGEYMAMARPVVAYDLVQSRFTAGAAAAYARCGDAQDFAARIHELLEDPARRAAMGAAGRARIEGELSWAHSERALLAAYDRALGRDR